MTLKVIGAGFGRTGTLSLKLALEQLGFGPCYHMVEVFKNPEAPGWWVDAADGNADWSKIFAGYDACVDWPAVTFYAALADAYPQAKVILTERDPEEWFRSTQATIFPHATPPGYGRAIRSDVSEGDRPALRQPHARSRPRRRGLQTPQRRSAQAHRARATSRLRSRAGLGTALSLSRRSRPGDADAEDQHPRGLGSARVTRGGETAARAATVRQLVSVQRERTHDSRPDGQPLQSIDFVTDRRRPSASTP
jgi:Sulfotransferase domain